MNGKQKWISRGLKKCSVRKRQLLWKYRLKPSIKTKTMFITYSKLLKKIIRLTKRSQNNYKIKSSDNKCKTTWQIINDLRLNSPRDIINKIKVNNNTVSDPNVIANAFNNYFVD